MKNKNLKLIVANPLTKEHEKELVERASKVLSDFLSAKAR